MGVLEAEMLRTHVDLAVFLLSLSILGAGADGHACTSIMVSPKASADGSVMTSHTCDSHRTSSDIHVRHRRRHRPGTIQLTRRKKDDSGPMERYSRVPTGKIPQVPVTYGYLAPAYAAMNEHQLAIGESTFEGRKELVSKKGLIDCETLCALMLERAKTAREAIRVAGKLLARHGWNDVGETLTIADPREVWQMEIVGPGEGRVGAVWAAQRIPDGHVGVVANASRIRRIDLSRPDSFMASDNVTALAAERGWWDPKGGKPFEFNGAYNPKGRTSFAATRREWRVLSLLAPSLELDPNSNTFPFSVKPEKPVTPKRVMEIFRDTFEGTEFDMVKHLTVADDKGKVVKSPLANPFMPYDMNKLLKINGGWGWRGERALARWYCMYVTVTQSRAWLPNPIGGIVWFGYDNPAMTTYVPLYAGILGLPRSYETDGRSTGFSRRAAWWAFNRASTIAAHRWGEMRANVAKVRDALQARWLAEQKRVDQQALKLHRVNPGAARRLLTTFSKRACNETVKAYWKLGDQLWTKYDEKW
jgi:dipeptidase